MFDRIKTVAARYRDRRKTQKTYAWLLKADEHLLRDIDVNREDVRRAMARRGAAL